MSIFVLVHRVHVHDLRFGHHSNRQFGKIMDVEEIDFTSLDQIYLL